ncbi:MAG: TraM recognition domain-containing protein [Blastocatellia bacterium]
MTVGDIRYFIYWKQKAKRDELIDKLRSESIKDQLTDFYSVADWKFKQDIESTRNKLQKFIHPQMRRIMSLTDNNVHLENIIEKKRMLLCNFQAAEDELIGSENTRVLGTLLISELWESFRKRGKPTEFYLIIDECDQFIGPDVQQILNEAAKYGLHLMLFHQHEGQIKDIAGAMKNAQTKIVFSTEESPKKQRYFTLRQANHETIEVETPEVRDYKMSAERIERYVEKLTQYFLTCEQVDERLKTSHNEDTPTEEDLDPNG